MKGSRPSENSTHAASRATHLAQAIASSLLFSPYLRTTTWASLTAIAK
jgi:hypothetical protein